MEFEVMTPEQYRALDSDAFESRRSLIANLCLDAECDVPVEQLRAEASMISEEAIRRNTAAQLRNINMNAVANGAGNVTSESVVSGKDAISSRSVEKVEEDYTDSLEYRTAFKDYVMRGTAIPMELRADQNTLTSDVPAVIPTMLINRIVEKAETLGMILPLVTKTSFAAGIEIPIASMKPTATWVSEGASSDNQKYTTDGKVTFTHHKLRCVVSISMETSVMSLPVFEARLVESVAQAMVKAKETAILNGTGSGQPKGILAETPDTGQAIEVASGDGLTFGLLCECEAAIPDAYENSVKWFMSKKSFYSFVGMTDTNGQPVARVNFGIGGKPERTLLGREVVMTGDYLPSFVAAPDEDTLFAFLFDMSDYTLNSIYDMGITRRQDWDTEDMQTKAVTSCDGKVVDKTSLVTVTVKEATA